ncbi:hypothetical protein C8R47DRAFT_1124529 [Mycena vitilis]|nr:hypothetical protein C8R47DRAFT_1124529 [Mycena vitilis]
MAGLIFGHCVYLVLSFLLLLLLSLSGRVVDIFAVLSVFCWGVAGDCGVAGSLIFGDCVYLVLSLLLLLLPLSGRVVDSLDVLSAPFTEIHGSTVAFPLSLPFFLERLGCSLRRALLDDIHALVHAFPLFPLLLLSLFLLCPGGRPFSFRIGLSDCGNVASRLFAIFFPPFLFSSGFIDVFLFIAPETFLLFVFLQGRIGVSDEFNFRHLG